METMIESVRAWPWEIIGGAAAGFGTGAYVLVVMLLFFVCDWTLGRSVFWPLVAVWWLASYPLRRLGRWWRGRKCICEPIWRESLCRNDVFVKPGCPKHDAEALQTYRACIASGLSDAEARGTAWPAPEQPSKRAEENTLNTPQDCRDDAWSLLLRAKAAHAADPDAYDDPDDSDGPANFAPKNFNSLDGFSPGNGGPTPYGSKPSEDAKPVTRAEFDALAKDAGEHFAQVDTRLRALESARAGEGPLRH